MTTPTTRCPTRGPSVSAASYDVSETSSSGWALTSIVCDDSDSSGQNGPNTVTFVVDVGETVECVFTNEQPGTLTVTKVLPNDDGGTAACEDFVFQVDGGLDIPFESDCSNDLEVAPGTYAVTETEQAGYTASYDNCDAVVIAPGGAATCTITSDDAAVPGIAFVQTVGTATRSTNPNAFITVPVPVAGVAAGNSIIVALKAGSNTVTAACTDTAGNVYSQDVAAGGGGSSRAAILSAHNVTALVSGNSITCTYASFSGATAVSINEFSGLAAVDTLDRTASAARTNNAPNSGLTFPTAEPDELVFAYVQSVAWTPATSGSFLFETTYVPPYTQVGTVANPGNVRPAYRIVTATRRYQANGAGGGTGGWRALVATYKAASNSQSRRFVSRVSGVCQLLA